MKWIKLLFFLFIISCSMISCIENEFNAKDIMVKKNAKDGFVWYQFFFNGKFGIANEDGEVLTLPKYDKITYVSGDGYFELRKFKDNKKDTLIAIETKDHEKRIILKQGVTRYWKIRLDDGDRYYFETTSLKGNSRLSGVYDKNWNVIVAPIMEGSPWYDEKEIDKEWHHNPEYEGEGVERFFARVRYGDGSREIGIPLSICLNSDGDAVYVKEKMEYMNLYEALTLSRNPETLEPEYYHKSGVYWLFRIYRDFVLENHNKKYAYIETENNRKRFRQIIRTPYETSYYYLSHDNDYNISSTYEFEQVYDYDGNPIIWSFYDDFKEKQAQGEMSVDSLHAA